MHDYATSWVCFIFPNISEKTRKHIQVPASSPEKYLPTENEIFE